MTDEEFREKYDIEFSVGNPTMHWNGTIREFNDQYGLHVRSRKQLDVLFERFVRDSPLVGDASILVTAKNKKKDQIVLPVHDRAMFDSNVEYRKIIYECVEAEFARLR
ncbi:hypothetical protein ABRY94_11720 [Castellaniella ginsengisoli]|uniref:Uncharacterized protein n=1 Tax=Castellaniella ginsengisoli TaxID=546114 RepID=A0AB39ES77_9BURK